MNTYFFVLVFTTSRDNPAFTFGPYIEYGTAISLLERIGDLVGPVKKYRIHIDEMLLNDNSWESLGTRMHMTIEQNRITTGKL